MYCDSHRGGILPSLLGMAKREHRVLLIPLPLTCWEAPRESTILSATRSYHVCKMYFFTSVNFGFKAGGCQELKIVTMFRLKSEE